MPNITPKFVIIVEAVDYHNNNWTGIKYHMVLVINNKLTDVH